MAAGDRVDEVWVDAHLEPAGQICVFGEPMDGAVERLHAVLQDWAREFAVRRFGEPVDTPLQLGPRGLDDDESAAFLRAVDAGLLAVDEAGFVRSLASRQKATGGVYSLFSGNTYSGDPYVSLNTEYLIQLGAVAELVAAWGWRPPHVTVEAREFDAVAELAGRPALLMEAKARIPGADGLAGLVRKLVTLAAADEPPRPHDNASRKYVALLDAAAHHDVVLWLVASGARWVMRVTRVDDRLELTESTDPHRRSVTAVTAGG